MVQRKPTVSKSDKNCGLLELRQFFKTSGISVTLTETKCYGIRKTGKGRAKFVIMWHKLREHGNFFIVSSRNVSHRPEEGMGSHVPIPERNAHFISAKT